MERCGLQLDLAGMLGDPVDVEVYSDADEVELILNGNSLGTAPAGPAHVPCPLRSPLRAR